MRPAFRLRTALTSLVLVAACALLTGAPSPAEAAPGVHPTSGNSALGWYTSLSEAQRDARAKGKLLFIEVSRAPSRCMKCRSLFSSVLSPRSLGPRVNAAAVGVHFDWRGVDARVYARLKRNLVVTRRVDPMMAFLTPDLGFVSGFAPARDTTTTSMRRSLERCLGVAERKQKSLYGGSSTKPVEPKQPVIKQPQPPIVREQPKPPVTTSRREGFRWYRNLAEAQAAARAQGKFLFLMSTKPSCGLCEKMKNNVVPPIKGELSKKVIGYLYDITRPESRAADRAVRSMNKGARLMPLCGFATPDLKPLKGFSGPAKSHEVRSHMNTASRMYRR